MVGSKLVVKMALVCALVPFALSAIVATLASRPRLAARAFGNPDHPAKDPSDFGLSFTDVEYSPDCRAWWVTNPAAVGSVVIVHGFETSADPRATDPGPRFELATLLARHRYSSLVINLGYARGAHPHSGGHLEADDIAAAVRWTRNESQLPVAIVGFSAGGHAAVAAASRCAPVAVVTDSAFVDFAEVVADQGAALLNAPARLFGSVAVWMRLLNGCAPIDLRASGKGTDVPLLHIHGDADTAISHDNLERLASITGGRAITFSKADHLEAMQSEPERYEAALIGFLHAALARR